jgi:DNA-binding MarR family transcriptional regulator
MYPKLFKLIISIRKKCLQTEEKIRTELKLTPGEFNGLLALDPGEKIIGTEFSHRMGLSPSRGSRVISRLWKNGFLHMEQVPDDRRSVETSLTPKGTRMKAMIEERMEECEKRITSQFTGEESVRIHSALSMLVEAM